MEMILALALVAGLGIGYLSGGRLRSERAARVLDLVLWASLLTLLVGMGARIGADPDVVERLGGLGVRAVVIAAAAVAGSVVAVGSLGGPRP